MRIIATAPSILYNHYTAPTSESLAWGLEITIGSITDAEVKRSRFKRKAGLSGIHLILTLGMFSVALRYTPRSSIARRLRDWIPTERNRRIIGPMNTPAGARRANDGV